MHELILRDVCFGDENGFLLVEFVIYDYQLWSTLLIRLLVFSRLEERNKLSPSLSSGFLSFAREFVDVFLTEYDGFLANANQEVFAL